MTVKRPNLDQLRAVAEDLGMNMSHEDLESYSDADAAEFRGL